jgi:hypothetical protein
MKKLVVFVLAGAAALVWAGASSAQRGPAGTNIDYRCGLVAKKLTYLFWPKGHVGLPSELPPPISNPLLAPFPMPDPARAHVSVYRAGRPYLDSNWLVTLQLLPTAPDDRFGGIAATDRGSPSMTTKPCDFYARGVGWEPHIGHRKSTTTATALTCTAPTRVSGIGFGYVGDDPLKIRAHDHFKVFLEADTARAVAKLKYDTTFCERIKLPK